MNDTTQQQQEPQQQKMHHDHRRRHHQQQEHHPSSESFKSNHEDTTSRSRNLSPPRQRGTSLRGKVLVLTPSVSPGRLSGETITEEADEAEEEKKEQTQSSFEDIIGSDVESEDAASTADDDHDTVSHSSSCSSSSVMGNNEEGHGSRLSMSQPIEFPRRRVSSQSQDNPSITISQLLDSENLNFASITTTNSFLPHNTANTITTSVTNSFAGDEGGVEGIRRTTSLNDDTASNQSDPSLSTIGASVATGTISLSNVEGNEKKEALNRLISKKDSRRIWLLKGVTLVAFLLATLVVSFVIWYSTRQSEKQQSQAIFYERSSKIIDEFLSNLHQGAITGLDSMAVAYTSLAEQLQQQQSEGINDPRDWPFVVLPSFSVRASIIQKLSHAAIVAFVPRIERNQRQQWEAYSVSEAASKWIEEGLLHEELTEEVDGSDQDNDKTTRRLLSHLVWDRRQRLLQQLQLHQQKGRFLQDANTINVADSSIASSSIPNVQNGDVTDTNDVEFSNSTGIATSMFEIVERADSTEMEQYQLVVDNSNGPYYPIWQTSPVRTNMVNLNFLSYREHKANFGNELQIAMDRKQILFGQSFIASNDNATKRSASKYLYDHLLKEQGRQHEPMSMIFFPVMDSFLLGSEQTNSTNTSKSLGAIVALVHWREYLKLSASVPSEVSSTSVFAPLLALSSSSDFYDVVCVLANPCGETFSFVVQGSGEVRYLGKGDLHDTTLGEDFDEVMVDVGLFFHELRNQTTSDGPSYMTSYQGLLVNDDYCPYSLFVHPTKALQDQFFTNKPRFYTVLVVVVFLITCVVFLTYDKLVELRQRKIMKRALKSHEIVYSLFPENVRNRLFGDDNGSNEDSDYESRRGLAKVLEAKSVGDRGSVAGNSKGSLTRGNRVKNYLDSGATADNKGTSSSKPIADLFPHTTVLFADIAGFTAWSSIRDPAQVFTLLESVYAAFDKLAAKRKVFKVETIGDCYVAVTGLPNPQPDHAVIMVKFARGCLKTMENVTRDLEVELGPDTTELSIRIGIHSGPVTAGVLRGQKSRFQLFGDTVNTASRMESTGVPKMIHCSQQAADLLINANRSQWITPRKDVVHAKGKGLIQTYWVLSKAHNIYDEGSQASISENVDEDDAASIQARRRTKSKEARRNSREKAKRDEKVPRPPGLRRQRSDISPHLQRLIYWNVDLLSKLLKNILAGRRNVTRQSKQLIQRASGILPSLSIALSSQRSGGANSLEATNHSRLSHYTQHSEPICSNMSTAREEYAEAVKLPRFDAKKNAINSKFDPESIELDPIVMKQLQDYVTTVALAYNDNPFHNFEHASHVTMSANKILKRVVAAEHCEVRRASLDNLASRLHDYSYGITSDPLTHFACVFSAMIHDVDHPGVPNSQLIAEKADLAQIYNNQSIAEQNSFDFAWELLMDPVYENLRRCIYNGEDELRRFRQLVVNSLMATDVFDKELVQLRNSRWDKAFAVHENGEEEDTNDLKATIVIEHIIQAADVAHTMQHWHVYQKWNRRLFDEMYSAYKSGRGAVDPSKGWYEGELWFYDNYIIPLAQKLKECGVFGASSAEFLTYAMDNRCEWEAKGESIVKDMVFACTHQSEEFNLPLVSN